MTNFASTAETPRCFVGWRDLHDQDAVFHQPTELFGEETDPLRFERWALLKVWLGRKREAPHAALNFMVGKLISSCEPEFPELVVTTAIIKCALEHSADLRLFEEEQMRQEYIKNGRGDGSLRLGSSSGGRFTALFDAAGYRLPVGLEATMEDDGSVRLLDVSRYGTGIRANWNEAFTDANQQMSFDQETPGEVIYLQKSVS